MSGHRPSTWALASVVIAGLASVTAGPSDAATLRRCGYLTTGQATLVRATVDVRCATARRVLAKTDTARCFPPGARPPLRCTVEAFRCEIAFHAAHDGAGFTVTRCASGRSILLGKTGP